MNALLGYSATRLLHARLSLGVMRLVLGICFCSSLFASPPALLQPIRWTDFSDNLEISQGSQTGGSTLKKSTGGIGWNAWASSQQPILQDGFIDFKASAGSQLIVGFATTSGGTAYQDIHHALYLIPGATASAPGTLAVHHRGTLVSLAGQTWNAASIFRIARKGGRVEFSLLSAQTPASPVNVIYTSPEASHSAVTVQVCLYKQGSTLSAASILTGDQDNDAMADNWERSYLGADAGYVDLDKFKPYASLSEPATELDGDRDQDGVSNLQEFLDGTNPHNGISFMQSVKWTALQGAEADSSSPPSLRKTSPYLAWNADAVSEQRIVTDGSVSFQVPAQAGVAFGLSVQNVSRAETDLDYGFICSANGIAFIRRPESTTLLDTGKYTASTVFTLQRSQGKLYFLRDGLLVYTSTTPNSQPLMVDASLYSIGSQITTARIYTGDVDADGYPDQWEANYWPDIITLPSATTTENPATLALGQLPPQSEATQEEDDNIPTLQEYWEDTDPTRSSLADRSIVAWTSLTKVKLEGTEGGLKRDIGTSTPTWDADATSSSYIADSGKVAFSVTAGSDLMVGLSATDLSSSHSDLEYAIRTGNGTATVFEAGNPVYTIGSYTPASTRFVIRRVGTQVDYLMNGISYYTSKKAAVGHLYVDCSIASLHGTISYAVIYTGDMDNDTLPDSWEAKQLQRIALHENSTSFSLNNVTLTGFHPANDADSDGFNNLQEFKHGTDPLQPLSKPTPIAWNSLTNATATGTAGGIRKSGTTIGWNAAGISSSSSTLDGIASFKPLSASQQLVFGFNADGSLSSSYTDIDYGFQLNLSTLSILRPASLGATLAVGSYSADSIFSISRSRNTITWLKDGYPLHSDLFAHSSTSLLADCSLYALNHGLDSSYFLSGDQDADGLPDAWELQYLPLYSGFTELDAFSKEDDADSDGRNNLEEYQAGTSARLADTDGDGLPDDWELDNNLDPLDPSTRLLDTDSDGLTNLQEYEAGSNPNNADADADGLLDLEELAAHTNPNNPDTDNDGMPDGWEVRNAFNPLFAQDAYYDPDSDLVPTLWEYARNTDPKDRASRPSADVIVTTSPSSGSSIPQFATLQAAYDHLAQPAPVQAEDPYFYIVHVMRGIYSPSLTPHPEHSHRRSIAWLAQTGATASTATSPRVEGVLLQHPAGSTAAGLAFNAHTYFYGFVLEAPLAQPLAPAITAYGSYPSQAQIHLVNVLIRNWQASLTTLPAAAVVNHNARLTLNHCTLWNSSASSTSSSVKSILHHYRSSQQSELSLFGSILWDAQLASTASIITGDTTAISGSHNILQGNSQLGSSITDTKKEHPKLTPQGYLSFLSPARQHCPVSPSQPLADLYNQQRIEPTEGTAVSHINTADAGAIEWYSQLQFEDLLENTQPAEEVFTDEDYLPDWWERWHFGEAQITQLEMSNPDGDHLINYQEFLLSTDPNQPDSSSILADNDLDDDGFTNDQEASEGTNPFDPLSWPKVRITLLSGGGQYSKDSFEPIVVKATLLGQPYTRAVLFRSTHPQIILFAPVPHLTSQNLQYIMPDEEGVVSIRPIAADTFGDSGIIIGYDNQHKITTTLSYLNAADYERRKNKELADASVSATAEIEHQRMYLEYGTHSLINNSAATGDMRLFSFCEFNDFIFSPASGGLIFTGFREENTLSRPGKKLLTGQQQRDLFSTAPFPSLAAYYGWSEDSSNRLQWSDELYLEPTVGHYAAISHYPHPSSAAAIYHKIYLLADKVPSQDIQKTVIIERTQGVYNGFSLQQVGDPSYTVATLVIKGSAIANFLNLDLGSLAALRARVSSEVRLSNYVNSAEEMVINNGSIELRPKAQNPGEWAAFRLLPVELAPEKLTSNGDFDEGDTGGIAAQQTGAIADNRNQTLIAKRDSVDGRVLAGDLVTDDLHQGWFGLRPGVMPDDFFDGATITITRKSKIDPDTGKLSTGRVRFFATWGDKQELVLPPDDPENDDVIANNPAPRNLVGKVYGTNKTVPSGAAFWIEGLAPGKITLEYRIQKDSTAFNYEQTFEVLTEWTKAQWLAVVRDEIYLDSFTTSSGVAKNGFNNIGIDMNQYDVANDFLPNRPYIYSVYEYYAKLHDKDDGKTATGGRDKFLWAGLAKLAGAPVYGGMSDAQNGRDGSMAVAGAPLPFGGLGIVSAATLKGIQDLLIDANINIYNDLAYQFVAYRTGGLKSLEHLNKIGEIRDDNYNAWKLIDGGEAANVASGNQQLLQREQQVILAQTYTDLLNMWDGWIADAFSWLTRNPIVGGPSFQTVIPNGNIAVFADRWGWITHPQQGMWLLWTSKDKYQRQSLANNPLRTNAANFAFFSRYSLAPLR